MILGPDRQHSSKRHRETGEMTTWRQSELHLLYTPEQLCISVHLGKCLPQAIRSTVTAQT